MNKTQIITQSEDYIRAVIQQQQLSELTITHQPVLDLRQNKCRLFIINTDQQYMLVQDPISITIQSAGSSIQVESARLCAIHTAQGWKLTTTEDYERHDQQQRVANILDQAHQSDDFYKCIGQLLSGLMSQTGLHGLIYLVDNQAHATFIAAVLQKLKSMPRFNIPLINDARHVIITQQYELRGYAFFQSLENRMQPDSAYLIITAPSRALACEFDGEQFHYTELSEIPEPIPNYRNYLLYTGNTTKHTHPQIRIITDDKERQNASLLGYIRWCIQGTARSSLSLPELHAEVAKLQHELHYWQSLYARLTAILQRIKS
jgi:hypothetical protein